MLHLHETSQLSHRGSWRVGVGISRLMQSVGISWARTGLLHATLMRHAPYDKQLSYGQYLFTTMCMYICPNQYKGVQ